MSQRSFSLVDHKVAEAEFFLQKISACRFNFFELHCFMGAFVASARSITFSLQAVLGDIPGFAEWYSVHQKTLRNDPIAKFFHEFRTVNQHIGDNLVGGGIAGLNQPIKHFFRSSPEVTVVPTEDVVTACAHYFRTILALVFDCYLQFGPVIDAKQRYTDSYFASIGKTIEDAEQELGFPRGWTDIGDPDSTQHRWELLRRQSAGCEINEIFHSYLGKVTPSPEPLPVHVPKPKSDE